MAGYINAFQLMAPIADADRLFLCNALPTTYAEASSTYRVGQKNSPTINPAEGITGGFQVPVGAISDGTVNGSGTATHWAVATTDYQGEPVLWAAGTLSAGQAVVSGNTFTLTGFTIFLPSAIS